MGPGGSQEAAAKPISAHFVRHTACRSVHLRTSFADCNAESRNGFLFFLGEKRRFEPEEDGVKFRLASPRGGLKQSASAVAVGQLQRGISSTRASGERSQSDRQIPISISTIGRPTDRPRPRSHCRTGHSLTHLQLHAFLSSFLTGARSLLPIPIIADLQLTAAREVET